MTASSAASPPLALSPATIIRPASKPSASACPASQLSAECQSSCGAGKGCSGASRYSTDATGTPAAAASAAGPACISSTDPITIPHAHHDHKPGFFLRWFCSTNHKDIGTLYLIFATIAGIIGAFFSLIMRMELQEPGVQFLLSGGALDGNLWKVLVTAHGPVLLFFALMPPLIGGFGHRIAPLCGVAPATAFPLMKHPLFLDLL